jgi:protein SCO1/2
MNRRAMIVAHRACFAAALLTSVSLTGCGGGVREAPAGEAPLAGSAIGGPFTLTDSGGKTVRWSDFAGKFRIVYFGYTWCPDVCPTDVSRIAQGLARFRQAKPQLASQIVPIFISVDPERDTPAKVGEFVHAFSDDFIGLTGTPGQVKAAADAFKVYYKKGEPGPNGAYIVDHSATAYLMGRQGEPIALLPVEKDDQGRSIEAELEKWVR